MALTCQPPLQTPTVAVAIFSFIACTVAGADDVRFRGPFGVAAKPDGSFYVGEIGNKRVARFNAAGESIGTITRIQGYGRLHGVFDVDVGPSGNLYICDTLGHSVLVLDPNEKLILRLGSGKPRASAGEFHEPHFVAVHEPLGYIYVADTHNNRLQIFDMKGKLQKVLGQSGHRGLNRYLFANGVTCDEKGNVYAMNWTGGYVNIYNHRWEPVGTHGRIGKRAGEFNDAYCLEYHEGTFWSADTFSSRLQQFDRNWKVINLIDRGEGEDVHQLSHPTDLAFDASGNIYVADWKNDRVLKLDPRGNFLRKWGSSEGNMDYQPPAVHERDPSRGPRSIMLYSGIHRERIKAASKAGVNHIIVSFNNQDGEWGLKKDVDNAHAHGIRVSASIAIYSMGASHAKWSNRPEMFMWKKGGTKPDTIGLSYFHPEVRRWKARHIAAQAHKHGVDGIMLDYIRYPNVLMGYEPAMVEAFRKETGKDANEIEPDDWDWLKFRARYITYFIQELRYELAQYGREVEISVYVGPDWKAALASVVHDWREWVYMGIVDKVVLGLYSRDYQSFYEGVRLARETAPPRTKVCILLACQGGNLYRPEMLKKGADISFAADADEVGVYRDDAIIKLKMYGPIGEIATKWKSSP